MTFHLNAIGNPPYSPFDRGGNRTASFSKRGFKEGLVDGPVLIDIIAALSDPSSYPHPTVGTIEVIQTPMSVVFLTGDYAYKLKKPVNLGYLDYSTIEKRLLFCQREVELNRRLCPQAYLSVVTIRRASGKINVSEGPDTLEYAVKMRQLPPHRMMDKLLPQGQVSRQMVGRLAETIADFHARADTSRHINGFGELCAILVNTDENFSQTEKYIGLSITDGQHKRIKAYTDDFLRSHALLMHERVDQGRIRDLHGDLRAAHVCFTEPVCVYDCIEFNDRFRYGDVASEVAFLAMDIDRFENPVLSRQFVDGYVDKSGDGKLQELLDFYKCYRAFVRGKVESLRLDDPFISDSAKAAALKAARRYFRLAASYAGQPLALIIMVGLTGTGKSTVAQEIADMTDAEVVSSDIVRKKLSGVASTEHRYEPFEEGIYTRDFSRRTYAEAFRLAEQTLSVRRPVVIDASFLDPAERDRARELARSAGARFLAVECVLPEEVAQRRLEARVRETSASDGRWDLYLKQRETAHAVSELLDNEHAVVNTSLPWQVELNEIARKIET